MAIKPTITFDRFYKELNLDELMINKDCEIKKKIREQLEVFIKKGLFSEKFSPWFRKIYEFNGTDLVNEPVGFANLIHEMKRGRGEKKYVAAIYYRLHYEIDNISPAHAIDIEVLKEPYYLKYGEPVFIVDDDSCIIREELSGVKDRIFERRKQKQEHEIALRLDSYERSGVETQFENFTKQRPSGFWHLRSGPGMGKSTLMAALASRYGKKAKACAYFFRANATDPQSNTVHRFYDYVFAWLKHEYKYHVPLATVPTENRGSLLQKALFYLGEKGRISHKAPFFLFIDALDEISDDGSIADKGNPLNLNAELPDGVYIACSMRVSDTHGVAAGLGKRDFVGSFLCDLTGSEEHKQSVWRYAKGLWDKNTPTDHDRSSAVLKSASGDFVSRICEQANYNFLILKFILNDKDYWAVRTGHAALPGDLSEFFEKYLEQMIKGAAGKVALGAVTALLIKPAISKFNFARLNTGSTAIDDLLEKWISQGLLEVETAEGFDWLRIYHSAYRDFLSDRLAGVDVHHIIWKMLESLCPANSFGDDLRGMKPTIAMETIDIVLDLAQRTNNIRVLERVLFDLRTWQFAALQDGGLAKLAIQINYLNVSPGHNREVANFYAELSRLLVDWLSTGAIRKPDGNSYQIGDFKKIIRGRYVTADPRTAIYLLDYL